MNATQLEFVVAIAAPPEHVFALVTQAQGLTRWFCDLAESDPRTDGRLVMRWTRATSSKQAYEARWLELSPPLRAAFRGGHSGYPGHDAGTVTFTLAADREGTRLEVRHAQPESPAYDSYLESWRAAWPRALARLASVAAEPAA